MFSHFLFTIILFIPFLIARFRDAYKLVKLLFLKYLILLSLKLFMVFLLLSVEQLSQETISKFL